MKNSIFIFQKFGFLLLQSGVLWVLLIDEDWTCINWKWYMTNDRGKVLPPQNKKIILHYLDSLSAPIQSKMGMIQSFMDERWCSGKVLSAD